MAAQLKSDWDNQVEVLDASVSAAKQFLTGLGERKPEWKYYLE